jgi:hypothetical protein
VVSHVTENPGVATASDSICRIASLPTYGCSPGPITRSGKPGGVGLFDGGALNIKIRARRAGDDGDDEENSNAWHL